VYESYGQVYSVRGRVGQRVSEGERTSRGERETERARERKRYGRIERDR